LGLQHTPREVRLRRQLSTHLLRPQAEVIKIFTALPLVLMVFIPPTGRDLWAHLPNIVENLYLHIQGLHISLSLLLIQLRGCKIPQILVPASTIFGHLQHRTVIRDESHHSRGLAHTLSRRTTLVRSLEQHHLHGTLHLAPSRHVASYGSGEPLRTFSIFCIFISVATIFCIPCAFHIDPSSSYYRDIKAKLCPLIGLFTVESGWHLQLYTSFGNDLLYLVLFDKKQSTCLSIVNRVQVRTFHQAGGQKPTANTVNSRGISVFAKVGRGRRRWCIGSRCLCSSHVFADWRNGGESTWPRTILLD
jgi:hypothetical protein